jgi:hypothetical protein
MKTIVKKISSLVFILGLFSGCTDKDDFKAEIEESKCKTENLGIIGLNKYSFITYQTINGNQVIDEANSHKWEWKTYNDTIEITGKFSYPDEYTEMHHFFKKNQGCINYLSTRWAILTDTPSAPDWYLFDDTIYPSFQIQEYIEDGRLVGKLQNGPNGGEYSFTPTFWMEFTPENHHPAPYDYEQYYHP